MTRSSRSASVSKSTLKRVVAESLEENREWIKHLLAETLEDVALKPAIREGLRTRKVSKQTVMRALGTSICFA
jgi:hypothetical protein